MTIVFPVVEGLRWHTTEFGYASEKEVVPILVVGNEVVVRDDNSQASLVAQQIERLESICALLAVQLLLEELAEDWLAEQTLGELPWTSVCDFPLVVLPTTGCF